MPLLCTIIVLIAHRRMNFRTPEQADPRRFAMTATGCPLCDCPEPCGCYAEGYAAGRALRAGGGLGPGGPRQPAVKRRPFPGKCRSSSWCLWGKRPKHRRQTLATGRMRPAVIAAAHRLGGNPDQPSRPLVKTTALVNLAPQRVMQDGLLRRSGGARPCTKILICTNIPSPAPIPVSQPPLGE